MDNHNACEQAWLNGYKQGREAVEKKGPIDVAIVVRCKDCEHFVITTRTKSKFCNVWCTFQNMSEDNFCSYGERKNNDT